MKESGVSKLKVLIVRTLSKLSFLCILLSYCSLFPTLIFLIILHD
uniref:Uncharacterized protein n=1 Tax=Rhizophora mucronata TaxID=61149 RepID=A0A2P2NYS3_RHIMU